MMDKMKEALKRKMGNVIKLEISVKGPDEEDEKTSDLAPTVEDSDERGVVTEDEGMKYANALINQAPDHPASGKTLESIAKERAMTRMAGKKGLKA